MYGKLLLITETNTIGRKSQINIDQYSTAQPELGYQVILMKKLASL